MFSADDTGGTDWDAGLKQLQSTLNQEFIEIVVELHVFFQNYEKIEAWLYTKNPGFGNIAPMSLIARGRGHKVLQFIKSRHERD